MAVMPSSARLIRAVPLALLALVGCSSTAGPEVNILVAYSNAQQDDNDLALPPIIDTKSGGRTAVGIQGPIEGTGDGNGNGLQIGGRVAVSYYRQDIGDRSVAGEPLLTIEDFADLTVVAPMATVSYRTVFGDPYDGGFLVEPGIGAGLAVGTVSYGSEFQFGNDPLSVDSGNDRDTDVSYVVNPFLRLGYGNERFAIAAEGGYQFTGLEFNDGLGKNASEWYVGLFFGVRIGSF